MPIVEYEGAAYALAAGESVLDCLLAAGVAVPHSCKAGACGSCLMQASAGEVPARAQAGIKDTLRARGYFLACVCHPETSLTVAAASEDARVPAIIVSLARLGADVLRVRLACQAPLDFRAGQYVTLLRDGGLARSYSIASLPSEGELELHVRRIPGGRMSGWLHDQAQPGDRITLQGPAGECFYVPGREDQPMLLVGTGTGLAPLYGIVRDALRHGHRGPIHLFHGALREAGLYLVDELRGLAQLHPQFEYTPAVREGSEEGAIDQVVLRRYPKLTGWRGYVCGDPVLVQTLKRKLFLAGLASRDILADAFLPSAPPSL